MITIIIPKGGSGGTPIKGDPGPKGDKGDPGEDGGSGIVYSPPMSPVLMNQNDEIIISHPAIETGIQRNVNIWQQFSETGLTTILSDFDLADESQYIFENRNNVNLNGELSLKLTGAPAIGSLRLDMRDGVRTPNGNANVLTEWCLFNDITGNCWSHGSPVSYSLATRAGLYYSSAAANDTTAYIDMTIPADFPTGLYDMYIYGRSYDATRNYWVSFIRNGGTKYNYPSSPASWGTVEWHPMGKNQTFAPGDVLRFVRPDNGGADMGGVNFVAIEFVPAGQPAPTIVPSGNTGPLKNYSAGTYPTIPYYVITPPIDIDSKRISKINSMTSDATVSASLLISALLSFDDGVTWKYNDGTWKTITTGTLREKLNIHNYSLTTVLSWLNDYTCTAGEKIRFALDLKTLDTSATPKINSLSVNFDHKNSYKMAGSMDYDVSIYDQTDVVITKLSAGSKLTIIEIGLAGGVNL